MSHNENIQIIEKIIEAIKNQLVALGPMHPGSMSRQYQVCGRPGCRCEKPDQRHGPYCKLRYVYRGGQVCRFVRAIYTEELKSRLSAYKTFRDLMNQWIALSIRRGQIEFFQSGEKKDLPEEHSPAIAKEKKGRRNSSRRPR